MADDVLQLPLDFPPVTAMRAADFLPHAGARLALDWLGRAQPWPQHRLALWGGQGVGKTHLLHLWAGETGAWLLSGPRLMEPFWPEGPVAIDDADRVPSEAVLLHVLNAAAEARRPLLLSLSRPPVRGTVALPDLASRLRATLSVEIGPPGDEALAALFGKLLAERQLPVSPTIQRWLLTRLPRTAAAVREAAARLDHAAFAAKSAVTKSLATAALPGLLIHQPTEEDTL